MGLSEEFYKLLEESSDDPKAEKRAAQLVISAPTDAESNGLLALMYHDGIGVERDFDKAFEYAEAAAEEDEGLALYLLGFMCEHAETPDQADGGPRQKYDHYDAENFMERCSKTSSSWATDAHLWLGKFFMDMAKGGDPEIGIEHLETIGETDAEAAGILSDYYWDLWEYDYYSEEEKEERAELARKVRKWTSEAVRFNPHDYSFRMGCCYADGIGSDAKAGFRLARKYWEDAYGFGDWRGASAIATLYEERLESLGEDAPETERENCKKHIESWRKLAKKEQERQCANEPDPSKEED